MRSKKISSSSSKSKIPTKDQTKSKYNNHKANFDKLQYDYYSNTSLDYNKENCKVWEVLFQNLLIFLKTKVSEEKFSEIENFLKSEIKNISSQNNNEHFKNFEDIWNSIFRNNFSSVKDPNSLHNINKELTKVRKASIDRNNFINVKDTFNSTSNANYSEDLKLNENTSKNQSKIIVNTKIPTSSPNTNLGNYSKEYNSNAKYTSKNSKIKNQSFTTNMNTNISQNNSMNNKYISPNNTHNLIANKLQSNLKKIASKTNSNSRSISDSKDSTTNKNGKKSLTENTNAKIGLTVSNSNANQNNLQIPAMKIPSVKFPNTRGYNPINMFSKLNTKLKKKTGLSPDEMDLKFENHIYSQNYNSNTNHIDPINSNKSYIGNVNNPNLKISNPLQYKPITPQAPLESSSYKITKSVENKFSFANNILNYKQESQEKYKNNPKLINISKEPKNFSKNKSAIEKSIKNNNSKVLSNNLLNNNSTASNKENILSKISSQNLKILKIPFLADVNLNTNETFKMSQDNQKEINKMIINKHNKIIDLTFGHKETATGRFLSEKENENNLITQCDDEEKIKPEIFNEIKLNLDENLKNIFNFSYDNFHNKENSESVISSCIKSENSDFNDIQKDESIRSCNYRNEIAFEENEDRMKNIFFNQSSIK